MTEDEAKEKWCPFASSRICDTAKNGGLEWGKFIQEHGLNGNCIGSKCMAWRTFNPVSEMDFIELIKNYRSEHSCGLVEAKKNITAIYGEPDKPCGFCGLAGKE